MKKLVIIGAGNVAWHLGHAAKKNKYEIVQVYSRSRKSAAPLAKKLSTSYTTKLSNINRNADVYLIAIKDDAIPTVASEIQYLNKPEKLFLHTSGTLPLEVLSNYFDCCGAFWPPQSINKNEKIDIKNTPFCTVAVEQNKASVNKFARSISKHIYPMTGTQKLNLHLAAVFANNFSNHMFSIAYELCQKNNLDFQLLLPIIQQTCSNVKNSNPANLQTGPAIRGDQESMAKHLNQLKEDKSLKNLYLQISKHINSNLK